MDRIGSEDEKFMRAAIDEAREALSKNEVPIGAVVVRDGQVIGRGHNLVETLSDATAHAEMQALTAAASSAGKYLPDCTLYVTVEPCPMCAAASAWSQVGRIVYATPDPKRGYSLYGPSLLHPRTKVESGPGAEECAALMTEFFSSRRNRQP